DAPGGEPGGEPAAHTAANGIGDDLIARRRAAVAGLVGATTAEVGAMVADLSKLKSGVFFDIDGVGLGIMGARVLSWESFGLAQPETAAIRINPPSATTVPDEYRLPLTRQVARAHQLLEDVGHRVATATIASGVSSSYRWVPAKALLAFEEQFAAIVAAFDAARARLLEGYEAIRERAADDIHRQAVEAATRGEWRGDEAPDEFADRVRSAFALAYPPREAFAAMTLRKRPAAFFLGTEIEDEIARTEAARRERRRLAEEERLAALERDLREEQLRHQLWADQAAIDERLAAERRRLAEEEAAATRVRELHVEALREAARRHVDPFLEIIDQGLEEWADLTAEMLALIKKHGHLPGAARERFLDHLALLRLKAFWLRDDDELARRVAEMEGLIQRPPAKAKGQEERKEQTRALAASMAASLTEINGLCIGEARRTFASSRMAMLEL
ncbi:MAG: hypothetical protein AVDCRST_MAG88-4730, partial [uncultured Thermomicrobiales bacterium]